METSGMTNNVMFMTMNSMMNDIHKNGNDNNFYKYLHMFATLMLVMTVMNIGNELIQKIKTKSGELYISIYKRFTKKTCIMMEGFDEINGCNHFLTISNKMCGLGYYLFKNNKTEGIYITEENQYIIQKNNKIKINDNIYIDVEWKNYEQSNSPMATIEYNPNKKYTRTIIYQLYSYHYSYDYLNEYLGKLESEYETYMKSINDGKQYHFIYTGDYDGHPQFIKNLLIDQKNPDYGSYETFDSVFSEHKKKIMNDIDRLRNKDFYRRNGLKRKKGYLFYGIPGCGKTSHVMAIAHHDKRHIIEVPLSRVKTNKQFEALIHINRIHDIAIHKENIIILFDEIDVGIETMKKREAMQDNHSNDLSLLKKITNNKNDINDEKDDNLTLDTILSRLDGIGNYNGLITIATTNCIDNLDPAIYRHGRLDPHFFDYSRKEDIIQMIETYYEVKLSEKEIQKIPGHEKSIAPATLKKLMNDYSTKDELIRYLVNYNK
jgi:hypothetical protein